MKKLFTIVLCILLASRGHSQTEHLETHYEAAYSELKAMLEGEEPLSFKRAVFVTENAFLDNTLDYQEYLDQIGLLAHFSTRIQKDGNLDYSDTDLEDVRKKFAVYSIMKDTIPFVMRIKEDSTVGFETQPFTYDFDDFFGDRDWTKMFVTKLLTTHKGNCHSLPFLYKIIAEEIGTDAHLAMSPNHTYVKQWTNKTGWFNTELTSGQFPIDSWIMASGYIKLEAIQNRLYMDTLSQKQSIAVTLTDLAKGHQKKFGTSHNTEFVSQTLGLALKYYPYYTNALIMKAELEKSKYEILMQERYVDSPSDLWDDPQAKQQFEDIRKQYLNIHKLGYRQMPKEMYLNWLMDIEEKDTDKSLERYAFEVPQPFEEYGKKVKVSTLSKGKYQEFFDQGETAQIGSVVLNRLTGQISHFVEYDTVYSEATLEPEIISRWLNPDPLAEEFYNWSPYNFVYNNPIRFNDPTGLAPVDFYNQNGTYIGNDGNDDGRVVVVTNNKEARQIKATNKAGGTTSLDQVKSGVELPNAGVRAAMGAAADRTGQPTNASMSSDPNFVADTKGGAHEEGGIFGKNSSGEYVVNNAEPGSAVKIGDAKAQVNVFSGDNGTIVDIEGTFHTHPSISSTPGANTIGGTTRGFGQSPSPDDFAAAATNNASGIVTGNNYVLGTGSGSQGGQKVYIYNGSKVVATFPLKKFVKTER